MALGSKPEPQSAADYDDRTTRAVKSVLIELAQILGSYQGKFVVIGGAVPWLLIETEEMVHVGTVDIDIALDAASLAAEDEYATLVQSLLEQGYQQRDELRKFQLVREVKPSDGGAPVQIVIDFLMPRDVRLNKNKPPLLENFAVQRADGADLALRYVQTIELAGEMPSGGQNRVRIAVASIPALLVMKGFAIAQRLKTKDAYDIYFCVANFPGGPEELARLCQPLLQEPNGRLGFQGIASKFDRIDGFGPTSVRRFVEDTDILEGRTPDQWQADAFGQVSVWLVAMGLVASS